MRRSLSVVVSILLLSGVALAQVEKDVVGMDSDILTAAWSPDGKSLITAGTGDLVIWDTTSWTGTASMPVPSTSVAIPNGGKYLALKEGRAARFYEYDEKSAKPLATFGGGETVWALQLVGDAIFFTTDSGKLVKAEAKTGTVAWTTEAHSQLAIGLHVNGNHVATCSKDTTVKTFDAKTGKLVRAYEGGHTRTCENVRISADGKTLVSGGADGLFFWDTATGQVKDQVFVPVYSMDMTTDGKLVSVAGNKGLSLWDGARGTRVGVIGGVEFTVATLSPDGKQLAAAGKPWGWLLRVYDVAELLQHPKNSREAASGKVGHSFTVVQLGLSKDGKTAFSSQGKGGAKLWDLQNQRVLREFSGREFALAPDGKSVAILSGEEVVVFATADGAEKKRLPVGADVKTLDFDAKAQRLLVQSPTAVRVFDVAAGSELANISGEQVGAARFSPDGKTVAMGDGPVVNVVEVKGGKLLVSLVGHSETVTSVAFSGNGKVVGSVSRSESKAITWDVAKKAKLAEFAGHTDSINAIDLDPAGKLAVTGSNDGTARLWEVKTGKAVKVLHVPLQKVERDVSRGYSPDVRDVKFTADGKRVFAAGANRTIRSWDVKTHARLATLTGFFPYALLSDPTLAAIPLPFSKVSAAAHSAAVDACSDGKDDEALAEVQKAPMDYDFLVGDEWTLLLVCASKGATKTVKELVSLGANSKKVLGSGEGALEMAARNGFDEILTMMIAEKADVNRLNKRGESPLMLAVAKGHTNAAKRLIDAGADVKLKGPGGALALHYAAGYGTVETVKLLLEAGADPNAKNDDQNTASEWAEQKGKTDSVAALVAAGGN